MHGTGSDIKSVEWVGSSRKDLRDFPDDVRRFMGQALFEAQLGGKHPAAKPLRGFHGAGVLEIVDDFDGNTYRAVYTVRFASAIFVLHAFQKKAKKGIATPKHDVGLIQRRLRAAVTVYGSKL